MCSSSSREPTIAGISNSSSDSSSDDDEEEEAELETLASEEYAAVAISLSISEEASIVEGAVEGEGEGRAGVGTAPAPESCFFRSCFFRLLMLLTPESAKEEENVAPGICRGVRNRDCELDCKSADVVNPGVLGLAVFEIDDAEAEEEIFRGFGRLNVCIGVVDAGIVAAKNEPGTVPSTGLNFSSIGVAGIDDDALDTPTLPPTTVLVAPGKTQ